MKEVKPCLIPSCENTDVMDTIKMIAAHGIENYLFSEKFDGVRTIVTPEFIMGRSFKQFKSIPLNERFEPAKEFCREHNVRFEGEFHSNDMSFNEIYRFMSNTDVRSDKELKSIKTKRNKMIRPWIEGDKPVKVTDPIQVEELKSQGYITVYQRDYGDRDIPFLTTFHDSLKLKVFDCRFYDEPDLTFDERMGKLSALMIGDNSLHHIEIINQYDLPSEKAILETFNGVIELGGEGLVATRKDRGFKADRYTLKEAQMFKLKNNNNVYDGVILDVEEGTKVKEGVERKVNELGYSETSNCKEDREPSGLAKGFRVKYGYHTLIVGLKGWTHDELRDMLVNKQDYIGRHFTYKAMPPVKNVPRHAFFEAWRDEK